MPLDLEGVDGLSNFAFICWQFDRTLAGSDHLMFLLRGDFSDEDLARYCVMMIDGRIGSINASIVGLQVSPAVMTRFLGRNSFFGWPCLHCGQCRVSMPSCEGCHFVHYCSRRCQRRGWPLHLSGCDAIRDAFGTGIWRRSHESSGTFRWGGRVSAYDYYVLKHLAEQLRLPQPELCTLWEYFSFVS